jgi:hypothetical protein
MQVADDDAVIPAVDREALKQYRKRTEPVLTMVLEVFNDRKRTEPVPTMVLEVFNDRKRTEPVPTMVLEVFNDD